VGNSANLIDLAILQHYFWRKCWIGTGHEMGGISQAVRAAGQKGRMKMSGLNFKRHLIAVVGSLMMSSIAVGAAIGPSQVAAAPLQTEIVTYA
jgi:hypothetical protein